MKKQVLIIEDQLSTRRLLSNYLGNSYTVTEKENAKDAVKWLELGNQPDAIIADILMPEMSGIEFLSTFKDSNFKETPIIILSSVENSAEKIKCFNLGARDYMVKPFNPEELSLRLTNLIKF